MRHFGEYNPIVVFSYYMLVAGITMFVMNPVILALSLIGAVTLVCTEKSGWRLKTHMVFLGLFVFMSLLNPLFQHKGATVLFFFNDNPVTLEAFIYGIVASVMILAVIYWFKSFSVNMTSDKLLYLFGKLSPKLSLILSMTLRYIPLFGKQAKKVEASQRALGLYKEDNAIDELKGKTRVFSVMVTWALENGIITADSMEARGYGLGPRSGFSVFRFRKADIILLVIVVLSAGLTISGICLGYIDFEFYPVIGAIRADYKAVLTYIFYGILTFLPLINNLMEEIRWKFLQSKI